MKSIKLSSAATREYWEIPVLFEDEHLLALAKPSGLLTSPDLADPERPSLMKLLHRAIAEGKPWVKDRHLAYLTNAHRLDRETTGVMLLAKSKPVLAALANQFGADQPCKAYFALAEGSPTEVRFEVTAKLAPHPQRPDLMRVDARHGKKSRTRFEVLERFSRWTLLKCEPQPDRPHQVRVHLRRAGFPLVADKLYGGHPLLLSRMKPGYRLKPTATERPLVGRPALHAAEVNVVHPITQEPLNITAPLPKDLAVGLKYLRQFAAENPSSM